MNSWLSVIASTILVLNETPAQQGMILQDRLLEKRSRTHEQSCEYGLCQKIKVQQDSTYFDFIPNGGQLVKAMTYQRQRSCSGRSSRLQLALSKESESIVLRENKYVSKIDHKSLACISKRESLGVKFYDELSWLQVLKKAKTENKHIFVNCYATWCSPYLKMEKNIYTLKSIPSFLDSFFISVRFQMDSTIDDVQTIKDRYRDADSLKKGYTVIAYPTFLFFNPEGKIVHRDLGFKNAADFVTMIRSSMDTTHQFYRQMDNYYQGKKNAYNTYFLAVNTKRLGYNSLALTFARDYKKTYIDKLSDSDLIDKSVIDFMTRHFDQLFYQEGSSGKLFHLFYKYGNRIDSIMNSENVAEQNINDVVAKDDISSKIGQVKRRIHKLYWKNIFSEVAQEYGMHKAETIVVPAELSFYRFTGDYLSFVRLVNRLIVKYSPKDDRSQFMASIKYEGDDLLALSTLANYIFYNCSKKDVLKMAVKWTDLAIKLSRRANRHLALNIHTKANLLYKLGHIQQAIKLERCAARLIEETKNAKNPSYENDSCTVYETINKMQKGIPTWERKVK